MCNFSSLIVGLFLGFLNGVMVVNGRIQPFIATLVSMTAYRGIAMIYCDGRPISRLGDSSLVAFLGQGQVLGIPVPVWIMIILFFIFRFFLQNTVIGRNIYATGSNAKAAGLAGISIPKVKYLVYAVSGFTASFAGLILVQDLDLLN